MSYITETEFITLCRIVCNGLSNHVLKTTIYKFYGTDVVSEKCFGVLKHILETYTLPNLQTSKFTISDIENLYEFISGLSLHRKTKLQTLLTLAYRSKVAGLQIVKGEKLVYITDQVIRAQQLAHQHVKMDWTDEKHGFYITIV